MVRLVLDGYFILGLEGGVKLIWSVLVDSGGMGYLLGENWVFVVI